MIYLHTHKITYCKFGQKILSIFHRKNPSKYVDKDIINNFLHTLHFWKLISLISSPNDVSTRSPYDVCCKSGCGHKRYTAVNNEENAAKKQIKGTLENLPLEVVARTSDLKIKNKLLTHHTTSLK